MKILNFGSLNIDDVFQVEEIVKPGQTISSSRLTVNCGGKGLNQSIAAAKAGAQVFHAGAIGQNDAGFLKGILEKNNVDASFVDSRHEYSGRALIQCDRKGQNCIVLYGGANLEIKEDYVDFVISKFQKNDILILQNEISSIAYIMKKAHEIGMKICFNPSPVNEMLHQYPMDLVDLLLLNEIEGEELTGESNYDKMIEVLLHRYPNMKIVLTLGEKGAIYAEKDKKLYQDIFPADAVDTTAAGDTFTGYFISIMESEGDVKKALQLASAASAIAVSREGAAKSIPKMEEVTAFIASENRQKCHLVHASID